MDSRIRFKFILQLLLKLCRKLMSIFYIDFLVKSCMQSYLKVFFISMYMYMMNILEFWAGLSRYFFGSFKSNHRQSSRP